MNWNSFQKIINWRHVTFLMDNIMTWNSDKELTISSRPVYKQKHWKNFQRENYSLKFNLSYKEYSAWPIKLSPHPKKWKKEQHFYKKINK